MVIQRGEPGEEVGREQDHRQDQDAEELLQEGGEQALAEGRETGHRVGQDAREVLQERQVITILLYLLFCACGWLVAAAGVRS